MIELRLRAATSNPCPSSLFARRSALSLAALTILLLAPVGTSRAQDASVVTTRTLELDALHASKGLTIGAARDLVIDAGDSVTIKNGAASIIMKKDGTIVLRGTDIIIDGARAPRIERESTTTVTTPASRSRQSDIF